MTRSKIFIARAGALMLALACAGAHAATITVNTMSDAIAADGQCSIREAVTNANNNAQTYADCAAGNGADTIVFDATVFATPQTILLSGGVLSLTDSQTTTIDGAGKVTFDGANTTQILTLGNVASAQLSGLTLDRGNSGGNDGGAIFSQGTLALVDSTVSGSTSYGGGGGIENYGGTLTLTGSRVTGNTAWACGGIVNNSGMAKLVNSQVTGNRGTNGLGTNGANGGCGGIGDNSTSGNNGVILEGSTVSDNIASSGGGIKLNSGRVTLTNSTVTRNSGGGITGQYGFSSVTLISSTVSANSDHDVGFIGYNNYPSWVVGSIVTVMQGALTATSHDNLIGSVANVNLGPLQDNGGPTQTMQPGSGSVAIDAIACTGLPPTDQRGVARPQGAQCDIGAVEVVVNDLIFANGFEAPSQCSGVTAASAVWGDEFAGGNLSATLWNANVNGGSLVESNGVLAVSSTANQFPFVTAISPIPATGSFSVRWKAQYTNVAANGDGTLVISKGLPTNGANDDYSLRRADAWQDSTNGFQVRTRTSDSGAYGPVLTASASSTATHNVEYCWLPNTVEIWVDGALQSSSSNAGLTRPDSLWFGNPVVRGVSGQPWTSFALDYVHVKALTTQ